MFLLGVNALFEASLVDREIRRVVELPMYDILDIVPSASRSTVWTAPGGTLAMLVTRDPQTLQAGFHLVSLADGTVARQWHGDIAIQPDLPLSMHSSVRGEFVAFVAESASQPPDVWRVNADLAAPTPISRMQPGLRDLDLGASRLITWTTEAGEELRGALLLPPGYTADMRYPVIVHVYGDGPGARVLNQFGFEGPGATNQQLLATRGYAVFFPDTPLGSERPADDIAAAVIPGVDRLIELGIADPDRIGVTGHSFGGYSTLALLTRSNRFAAAISEYGFGNLIGYYTKLSDDGSGSGASYLGRRDPWRSLPAYVEQSPFFRLADINAPLLLIHGTADRVVPPALSTELFVGLRALGKDVVLALYHGEGHGHGGWTRRNLDDYWRRVYDWWERWLGVPRRSP